MKTPKLIRFVFAPTFVPFVIRALVLVSGLTALTLTETFDRLCKSPLISVNAWLTHHSLTLFGTKTTLSGSVVYSSDFSVEIVEGCTGLFVFILLLSATVAFPASWSRRLTGIGIGAAMVFVVNWARIVSLFYLGRAYPDLFEEFHVYVWQGVIIVLVTLYWYTWALRFSGSDIASEA